MKKGLIVLVLFLVIGFVGCAGLVGYFVYWAVGEVKEFGKPADEFLALIASGDIKGAYDSGATGLRSAQSLEEFTAAVKKMGLTGYQSSNWSSWNRVNNEAKMSGTVTLKDGGSVPLTVNMLKEGDVWKVVSLSTMPGGATASNDLATLKMPTDAELKILARDTLLDFDRAIKDDDFSPFIAKAAKPMRDSIAPDEFRDRFKDFVQNKANFGFVETREPELTGKPGIDADGRLVFEGFYATKPAHLKFVLGYIRESGTWKLVKINLNTVDPPSKPKP